MPLQCDEPADFSSFRVRLFGLEKLHKSECAHQLDQPIRMLALTGRCCRRLFYQGGILLRHLVELHHRGVDVVNAGTLLGAGQGDFADELRDLLGRAHNVRHRVAGMAGLAGASLNTLNTGTNQGFDFACSLG